MPLIEYYSPFRNMSRVLDNVDSYFRMPVDIKETDDEFILTAEIPGFTTDEIEIELSSDQLIIKAEHKSEDEKTDGEGDKSRFVYRERRERKFMRRFNFRKPVDTTKATSSLKDGLLSITLPKAEGAKAIKLIPESN